MGGEVLKNIEGVPHSLSPLSTFTRFLFCTSHQIGDACLALPWLLGCAARASGDDVTI